MAHAEDAAEPLRRQLIGAKHRHRHTRALADCFGGGGQLGRRQVVGGRVGQVARQRRAARDHLAQRHALLDRLIAQAGDDGELLNLVLVAFAKPGLVVLEAIQAQQCAFRDRLGCAGQRHALGCRQVEGELIDM